MKTSKLSDEIRSFIVQGLACYDTPSVVAEAVKQEFGVAVTRQAVESYDPTKYAGRSLANRWRTQFEETRAALKKATVDIPVAHRAYRLRALQRMFEKAEAMRNLPLAASLLKQAAEEIGDVYTNRQRIDAKVQATARTVIVPAKAQ